MPTQTIQSGSSLLHINDLSSPAVKLDVTKDRALLKEPEVSEFTGYDILRRGILRPERGRKPAGISIPVADQPIVSAVGLSDLASVVRNHRYSVDLDELGILVKTTTSGSYVSATGVISSVGTGWEFTEGDVCAIHLPVEMRGVYPIFEAEPSAAGTINIPAGLHPDVGSITLDVIHSTPLAERLIAVADETDWLVKTPALYKKEGPFVSEVEAGLVIDNSDERQATESSDTAPTLATRYQLNDSIDTEGGITPNDQHKVQVLSEIEGNLRGVLMTNGRKFWLLQGGRLKLMIDLGDDSLKGQKWRTARIARNRIMLVNPKYAPRVLHLDSVELKTGEVSGDETLAGCVTPVKPRDVENRNPDLNVAASWLGFGDVISPAGGLESDRHYKIKIRGVNLEDDLETEFVQVFSAASLSFPTDQHATLKENILTGAADKAISVYMATRDDGGFAPPFHSRITHIEVWRSTASTANDTDAPDTYFLESRMEVVTLVANEAGPSVGEDYPLFNLTPRAESYPVQIADAIAPNLGPLTSEDLLAGGLPPICQDVVALEGVTFCFGKADATIVKPTVDGVDFFGGVDASGGGFNHSVSSSKSRFTSTGPTAIYTNYTFLSGDKFEVLHGGRDANDLTIPTGVFDINARISTTVVELEDEISSVVTAGNKGSGHILRPYTINWPKILSDEEVWYSRTDKFNPESFPVRVKTLSRTGDIFRRAVKVSSFIVVVMDRGVHLLRLNGTLVVVDTIADSGEGTPWPDSVVVVGTAVLWATQQGLRVLISSPEADIEGRRARISPVGDERFRSWFEDAFVSGEVIDAGIDEINGCVRFRRAIITSLGTHYQVLQYNYRTDSFVFLDDDSGFIYANTVDVFGGDNSQRLYSVSDTGNIFEVNHEESTHPYDSLTLQGTLDKSYIITATSIERRTSAVFSPSMAGDVIRFRVGSVEYIRTITTATDKKLNFSSVPASLRGAVFVIAAVRTKIRFSPLLGKLTSSVKTVEKVQIKSRKGAQHASSEGLTLKVFSDFRDSEQAQGTVDIFDVDDSGKSTKNEVSSIEGQGAALEFQIETRDARTDFELQQVEVTVREDSDVLVDSKS